MGLRNCRHVPPAEFAPTSQQHSSGRMGQYYETKAGCRRTSQSPVRNPAEGIFTGVARRSILEGHAQIWMIYF